MLFSSCSNDEKVAAPADPGEISFTSFVNKSSRASAAVTNANLTEVSVYGYNHSDATSNNNPGSLIFDNVTLSLNAGKWTYADPRYWVRRSHYYFAAVNKDASVQLNNFGWDTANGRINYGNIPFSVTANDARKDVVYALARHATGTITSDPGAVQLNFQHALCRVMFTFTDAMAAPYSLVVNNVKLEGTPESGTFQPEFPDNAVNPTGSWTNLGQTYIAQYTNPLSNDQTNKTYSTEYRYLIPAGQAITVDFDVTLSQIDGNGNLMRQEVYQFLGRHLTFAGFEAGKSYNITATLNHENIDPTNEDPERPEHLYPIEFTVDVNEFTSPDIEVTM